MRKGKAKRVCVVLAILVVCLLGVRIGWVNAHAETVPTEHYGMGEWVDLSGSYLYELQSEDMQGYSIRITHAEELSYNEFVARYAKGSVTPDQASGDSDQKTVKASDNPDQKTIVLLECEVKNKGNDAGGINVSQYNLVPTRKNVAYTMDRDLWGLVEPQLKDTRGGFGLKKDSSYTTDIPFTFVSAPPYFQKLNREIVQPVADDSSFEITLCNAPVRKIIDVQLSS